MDATNPCCLFYCLGARSRIFSRPDCLPVSLTGIESSKNFISNAIDIDVPCKFYVDCLPVSLTGIEPSKNFISNEIGIDVPCNSAIYHACVTPKLRTLEKRLTNI